MKRPKQWLVHFSDFLPSFFQLNDCLHFNQNCISLQINYDGSPPLASFRRSNYTKIRKISNDNLTTHMNNISKVDNNTKNQLHENYSDDVEEFRRKTPNRFHEEKSAESPNLGSKSTKKSTGWGTDLDNSPVTFKCEPCNYTGNTKSAFYQHNHGQRHKNKMNNLKVSKNFKIHFSREISHIYIALFFRI